MIASIRHFIFLARDYTESSATPVVDHDAQWETEPAAQILANAIHGRKS